MQLGGHRAETRAVQVDVLPQRQQRSRGQLHHGGVAENRADRRRPQLEAAELHHGEDGAQQLGRGTTDLASGIFTRRSKM